MSKCLQYGSTAGVCNMWRETLIPPSGNRPIVWTTNVISCCALQRHDLASVSMNSGQDSSSSLLIAKYVPVQWCANRALRTVSGWAAENL